jgi:hypothetical protein
MKWEGPCSTHGSRGILVREPEGKRAIGRLKYRWEENIKMDLREVMLWGIG